MTLPLAKPSVAAINDLFSLLNVTFYTGLLLPSLTVMMVSLDTLLMLLMHKYLLSRYRI
ncbi:hypothetical protein [Bacteroides sp. AF20-13LB]|uniref:hypothetical protein n=1 Tax=Bacteroides sp. AF20-13LB TaxID=2292921 RepID=UPI001403480C|nr:hypothetical protein [Bacteroides sp. AF20-13LB]